MLLVIGALAALWILQRGVALPNTSIAGIDVSGMNADEIGEALQPLARAREDVDVEFTFEDETYIVDSDDVRYGVDVDSTAEAALRRGRARFPRDIVVRVRSFRRGANFPLQHGLNDEALRDWVDDLGDRLDREEVRGDVELDPDTLEVTEIRSQGSVEVDRERTLATARAAFLEGEEYRGELPADVTSRPIATAEIEAVGAQVRDAIDEPLALHASHATLTLEPSDVAELIRIAEASGGETGTTLQITVSAEDVEEEIGDVARGRFDTEPEDASYSASRTPPTTFDAQSDATYRPVPASVEVVAGHDGRRFDAERAAEQLTQFVRDGVHDAEIDLARVKAEFGNDEAERLRPTHAIGTFTTYYQAGEVRNENIQHLADVVDHTRVLPGDQFSINEVSGERTCERGYAPAGTIVAGELTDTCGGGTSQFGTTTFNAAFFAGVQLDQWKPHSWYISRYPMGREATLSYPFLDVRFTNNTPGAILVKTTHTPTSVTVTLYGQPIADAVTATHGSPTNHREFEVEIRQTSQLPPGRERVEQAGAQGFDVSVTRTVSLTDGSERTRTMHWTYSPQRRIVERGVDASGSGGPDGASDLAENPDDRPND